MKLTQIDVTGLVCALLTTLFLCQLSGPVRAAPGSEPASRQSSTFAKNAPMPAWALPLAAISETTRTDPLVYRLIEYQVQLGAETGMLANLALQVNERAALYWGGYPMNAPFWLSDDQSLLYTGTGDYFSTTDLT